VRPTCLCSTKIISAIWLLEGQLKPLYAKKLERWCGAVRERAENMLPSSLKTPAASALLSSEALNVVTPAAHSVGVQESECESGAENESECDGEYDDDSDDDLEIVGEESCTADSTGASSAGTEAPAKKAKITLTAVFLTGANCPVASYGKHTQAYI
jgi:hypothetical protein